MQNTIYNILLGETIRVFRRSRSGRPMSGASGGQANNNSNAASSKGDDHDEEHASKHAEDLPAPDTPAAVKDAGAK
jgi:hypothetical protein